MISAGNRGSEAHEGDKERIYRLVRCRVEHLLDGEDDWIAALATVACELHHALAHFEWTGFYRVVRPGLLAVGPYQGNHGCQRIPFGRGVCGAAARTGRTQRVDDVSRVEDYIACSTRRRSEIVIIGGMGSILGSFLGSAFILLVPIAMSHVASAYLNGSVDQGALENYKKILFGVLIVVFLIKEPGGIAKIWRTLREKAHVWPLRQW